MEVYNTILSTYKNKNCVFVIGSILSGLTFTKQKLLQTNIPENQVFQVSGQSFTDDEERELFDSLKMMVKPEGTKVILLAPEYFVSYVVSKLSDQKKQIDSVINEKIQPIQLIVTQQEAHNIVNETICQSHKELLAELPKDRLLTLECAWVEHAKRKIQGKYLRDYETHLPGLIISEIEETSRRWTDFKKYGVSNADEFTKLEGERIKKKRGEFSTLLTMSGISAAVLSQESRTVTSTVENIVGIIIPGLTLAAFGGAAALLVPALVADIRKWWKGKEKVKLEEFLGTIQYWNEFTVEERRLLCYEFDQQKKLRPGKSYEDLSKVFGDFDSKKLKEIRERQDNIQNEILNQFNTQKVNLDSEMKQLEDKWGKRFDELEKMNLDVKEIDFHIKEGFEKLDRQLLELNISIFEQCGLNLLCPKYFEKHKSTDDWKKGSSFELTDIIENVEFRRKNIDKIEEQLELKKMLLIVGESGTSKSTILKEIIVDYYNKGYFVLYNFTEPMKNPPQLLNFIETQVNNGKEVLVAVDNAHIPNRAAIFQVMKNARSFEKSAQVRFVVVATLPEFSELLPMRMSLIEEGYRDALKYFLENNEFRFSVTQFSLAETKEFLMFYGYDKNPEFDNLAEAIFNVTRGNPYNVFLLAFGKGMNSDVENKYTKYLSVNGEPVSEKIVTTLVCCLQDLAYGGVSEELLKKMGLNLPAEKLNHAILYKSENKMWNTAHSLWASAFLWFLFHYKENRAFFLENESFLKEAIARLFNLKNEERVLSITDSLYGLASNSIIPVEVAEDCVSVPDFLSKEKLSKLYSLILGGCYYKLRKLDTAIEYFNKGIELCSDFATAWNNKGLALKEKGQIDEAITCYDRAIELEDNFADAWYNKGLAFAVNTQFDEALTCFNKAIELDPTDSDAWDDKGLTLAWKGQIDEAITCYNKAIELDPSSARAWSNKGLALKKKGQVEEAIVCFNKAIELDHSDAKTWDSKGLALKEKGQIDEAITCYNKAIELNPSYAQAWNNKGFAFMEKKKLNEALACFNKAIEINPNDDHAWYNKGIWMRKMERFGEAIVCFNKAIEINPGDAKNWLNKGVALSQNERLDEALVCFSKALDIDSLDIEAWKAKGIALLVKKQTEEAIVCINKALDLNPEDADEWMCKGYALAEKKMMKEASESYLTATCLSLIQGRNLEAISRPLTYIINNGQGLVKVYAITIVSSLQYLQETALKEQAITNLSKISEGYQEVKAMLMAFRGSDRPILGDDIVSKLLEMLRKAVIEKARNSTSSSIH